MSFWSDLGGLAAGGIVSGGISALFGNMQNNYNANMMREQMKFHQQEREASQAYQTSERQSQQLYQTGEREAQNIWQESMYGKYQSPEAMVRQYNEAGINGKLAASGQSGMGSMSVSGGSNGGAPSSGAPSGSHVNAPYQNIGAMSAGFADIAGALKALGEAKKLGIETNYYEDEIKQRLAQSKIKTSMDTLDFDIKKLYGKPMAKSSLDKLLTEIEKDKMDIKVINKQLDILTSQGIIEKARADSIKEQIRLEQSKLSQDIEFSKSQTELNNSGVLLNNAKVDTEKTQQTFNKAVTSLQGQLGHYYSALSDLVKSQKLSEDVRKSILGNENRIKDYERRIIGGSLEERIQCSQLLVQETNATIELLQEQAREARTRGDLNEVLQYTETINAVLGASNSAMSIASKMPAAPMPRIGF